MADEAEVKAEHLRRGDLAWHREGNRFAEVCGLGAVPRSEEVEIRFFDGKAKARQRYRAEEGIPLKRRGVNAARVIERLCVPLGRKAGAWRSERYPDHTFHAGFSPVGDGPEFVAALDAWENGGHIRLLPDGGEFPYSFSLADDLGLAMIDYCEGDVAVRVYDELEEYVRAPDLYARGPLETSKRRSEHERNVVRALHTGTFPGSLQFESRRGAEG